MCNQTFITGHVSGKLNNNQAVFKNQYVTINLCNKLKCNELKVKKEKKEEVINSKLCNSDSLAESVMLEC
jgi:hypothetical protein